MEGVLSGAWLSTDRMARYRNPIGDMMIVTTFHAKKSLIIPFHV